jgi:hypothetical protein
LVIIYKFTISNYRNEQGITKTHEKLLATILAYKDYTAGFPDYLVKKKIYTREEIEKIKREGVFPYEEQLQRASLLTLLSLFNSAFYNKQRLQVLVDDLNKRLLSPCNMAKEGASLLLSSPSDNIIEFCYFRNIEH